MSAALPNKQQQRFSLDRQLELLITVNDDTPALITRPSLFLFFHRAVPRNNALARHTHD